MAINVGVQLLIGFEPGLAPVRRVDTIRELADRHYSRQKVGAREFMPPGSTLVLRDSEGRCVFGWVLNTVPRLDRETGVCCTIFRNESVRMSSEIIRDRPEYAKDHAKEVARWIRDGLEVRRISVEEVRAAMSARQPGMGPCIHKRSPQAELAL